jgi:hypothetical protein
MSDEEVRERIVSLGFGGDRARFEEFCAKMREGLPPGTGVALRGSVITDERYEDGRPFDAKGPGTSDLDVTLVGDEARECWRQEDYYIPGLHTMPLSDKTPEVAPNMDGLRRELQRIAGRPVNFQATSNVVLFARDVLLNQPYYMLIEAGDGEA